ncbi:MAG TPA: VOC family protein [Candidatus Acidoferrum sp.]|nr:VOC family protein [Candidatus Acidoferrum sp.]
MRTITPHLWFDKQAKEAAALYISLLPNSKIMRVRTLHNTPSGNCDVVSFQLSGQPFMAISAGPLFKFNPSVSFHLKCATKDEVDDIWGKLSPGGKVLMPLDRYPFSARFGWLEDRYGLSWQVILVPAEALKQRITPMLMFVGDVCGKTEEAIHFYGEVFKNAPGASAEKPTTATVHTRYSRGELPDKEGSVRFASFTLLGQEFAAMDSAHSHNFAFNEAISFMVPCDSQQEIDYFWEKLAADPQAGQCGWLKDRYGVSWQVTPTVLNEMLSSGDPEKTARVTQAFLKMKKFDIAVLLRASEAK